MNPQQAYTASASGNDSSDIMVRMLIKQMITQVLSKVQERVREEMKKLRLEMI